MWNGVELACRRTTRSGLLYRLYNVSVLAVSGTDSDTAPDPFACHNPIESVSRVGFQTTTTKTDHPAASINYRFMASSDSRPPLPIE